jgi:hypothetical protein
MRPENLSPAPLENGRGSQPIQEQIIRKVRLAETMLDIGVPKSTVLQVLEVSGTLLDAWYEQYGGLSAKAENAMREGTSIKYPPHKGANE